MCNHWALWSPETGLNLFFKREFLWGFVDNPKGLSCDTPAGSFQHFQVLCLFNDTWGTVTFPALYDFNERTALFIWKQRVSISCALSFWISYLWRGSKLQPTDRWPFCINTLPDYSEYLNISIFSSCHRVS